MTISDESVVAAVGWIGTTMTAAITYLFFQVVSLNRRVGVMSSRIEEYKKDIQEYKDCPVPQCFFRLRKIRQEQTQTITTNNPQPA